MDKKPDRRPVSMWVVLAASFLIMLSGFARLVSSILNWYWLSYAGVAPGPLYLAISGGIWGLAGLFVLVWLWLRRPGYRLAGSIAALAFALFFWADRLLVMTFTGRLANAAFAVIFTLLSLVYVIITLRPWQELRSGRKPE